MKLYIIFFTIIILVTNPIQAQKSEFYVGMSYSEIKYDLDTTPGVKLFLGEKSSEAISGELQYLNFGFNSNNNVGSLEAQSIGYSILFKAPTRNRFQPFLRLGVHGWEADVQKTTTEKDSPSGVDALIGVGVNIFVKKKTFIRFEYEKMWMDYLDGESKIDLWSVSAIGKF